MFKSKWGWVMGSISAGMVLLDVPGWSIPWGYLFTYSGIFSSNLLLFFIAVTILNFIFYYFIGFSIEKYFLHKTT